MQWLHAVPDWLAWLGWGVLLLAFVLQRRARVVVARQSNTAVALGARNRIHQSIQGNASVTEAPAPGGGASALERWADVSTIVGLVVSVLPLLKGGLGA